jgi:hypothetical protein
MARQQRFEASLPACRVPKEYRAGFDRLVSSGDFDVSDHMRAAYALYLSLTPGLTSQETPNAD